MTPDTNASGDIQTPELDLSWVQVQGGSRRGALGLIPLLIVIVVVAFFVGSESLFYLAYVLGGLVLLSYLWMRQAPYSLQVERRFPTRAFYGEEVGAEVSVTNRGRLPILWMELHESLPLALHVPNFERRVVSLAPGGQARVTYRLACRRRGYYQLGPLNLRLGDFFDLAPEREVQGVENPFIVYPRIIPLQRLGLPSRIPYGELASRLRIFEDPSRIFGVREYQPGDSLRQINWKSSARAEQLLVKRLQPAIALNTLILLNLNVEDYSLKARADAGEVGIIVAASIAAHLVEQRQRAGLAVLGQDAVSAQVGLQIIPPLRGREHLMRMLELLARVELDATPPFAPILSQATANLGWGSSIVVITPGSGDSLTPAILELRRRGFHLILVATDPQAPFSALQAQLAQIGVPAFQVTGDKELDVWR
ncbi:MAG: DUF58 domain-containing protein [Anaerolineae bacterium]